MIGAIVGLGVVLIMIIVVYRLGYKRGRGQAAGSSTSAQREQQDQQQASEQRAEVAIQISEVATVGDEEAAPTTPDATPDASTETQEAVDDAERIPPREAEGAATPSEPSQSVPLSEPDTTLQEVDVTLACDGAEVEAVGAKGAERSRRRRKQSHRNVAIPEPTAENIDEIRTEHRSIKARLREYEAAFEERHGRKPRKKKDWAPVYVDYERYAALREAEKQAKEASAEADPPSESQ